MSLARAPFPVRRKRKSRCCDEILEVMRKGRWMSVCGPQVLIVDDEANMLVVLTAAFEDDGYSVKCASTGEEALELARSHRFDLALFDLRLPAMSGIELFQRAKAYLPDMVAIMITAHSSVDTAIQAMKMGAYDYVTKPFSVQKLLMVARNAIASRNESQGRRGGWALSGIGHGSDEEFGGVIGTTAHMKQLIDMANDVAPTNATVLIFGESGTGKELLANYIHRRSLRVERPFVKVNCSALPEPLLESELFGHEKGSFTHAISRRQGRFELADTGTIFLDEVGDMSPAMQSKLLRAIQEREFERVGGGETIKVDVRIIAATNRDLRQAVMQGTFRHDLYYRLSVVPLTLPPLRDRRQDIPLLVQLYIGKFNAEFGKAVSGLTPDAMQLLLDYHWPGNIREMANVMERAVLLSKSELLRPTDLHLGADTAEAMHAAKAHGGGCHGAHDARDDDGELISLEELEKQYIGSVLAKCNENRTRAAEALKITRRTLLNKIKKYDL